MKIVYILRAFAAKGGMERIFSDKMNYLADVAGYDVTFITYEQGSHRPAFPLSDKVRRVSLDFRFFTLYAQPLPGRGLSYLRMRRAFKKKLTATLDALRADVVVFSTYEILHLDFLLDLPYRCVVESHVYRKEVSIFSRSAPKLQRWIQKWVMARSLRKARKAARVVVLTENDRREWKGYTNLTVIPNALTAYPDTVPPTAMRPKRIIAVGRLHPQKGFDLLAEAWQEVAPRHPDWSIAVFGDGGDRERLQALTRQLGIAGTMTFMGATDDIYSAYMNSAFFVMSSRYEGWGLVLVEAMACGLPCVSFDCPYGPGDIINDGENGLLVENGNVSQLAACMERLIDNSDIREAMSARAREKAALFTKDKVMAAWTNLFENLLST